MHDTKPCACGQCAAHSPPCPDHRMTAELHTNCVVEVLRCPACGRTSIAWWPSDMPPVRILPTETEKE